MMSRMQLEKRYGIRIVDDSYYNPYTHRWCKQYKFYTADGCPWENGLRTLAHVERECKKWEREILAIKCGK